MRKQRYTEHLGFRASQRLAARLREIAAARDLCPSEIVREAVKARVARLEREREREAPR